MFVPHINIIVLCLILDSRQNNYWNCLNCWILYCALFWIQGKTSDISFPCLPDCTVPYFGFKAKHQNLYPLRRHYCTVPYFGFKAKPPVQPSVPLFDCTVPYFGFKAKQKREGAHFRAIVLCLILDSRQNMLCKLLPLWEIVLCLILDSRQNTHNHNNTSRYIVLCLILDSRQNWTAQRR